mmetsp:Transcript_13791/g.26755  ORF Transcript_13791/g.26755 Transcript_13791/m.26755 type:complete len:301 (-) Transcript_13791:200-1102(-)
MSAQEDCRQEKKARTESSNAVPLLAVGFCGVDESVKVEDVVEISQSSAPWAEWGVLFRPEKEGEPRFPSMTWVENDLCKAVSKANIVAGFYKVRLAAHLCSTRCEEVLEGNAEFVQKLAALGFRRVQINATKANNVDSSKLADQVDNVAKVIEAVPAMEFILQRNEETKPLWEALIARRESLANISVLFDDSVGTGVERTTFPRPNIVEGLPCGYAGGIGPHNIEKVFQGIHESTLQDYGPLDSAYRAPWVDMESSLREKVMQDGEEKDIFSLNRVRACIANVQVSQDKGVVKLLRADVM